MRLLSKLNHSLKGLYLDVKQINSWFSGKSVFYFRSNKSIINILSCTLLSSWYLYNLSLQQSLQEQARFSWFLTSSKKLFLNTLISLISAVILSAFTYLYTGAQIPLSCMLPFEGIYLGLKRADEWVSDISNYRIYDSLLLPQRADKIIYAIVKFC